MGLIYSLVYTKVDKPTSNFSGLFESPVYARLVPELYSVRTYAEVGIVRICTHIHTGGTRILYMNPHTLFPPSSSEVGIVSKSYNPLTRYQSHAKHIVTLPLTLPHDMEGMALR